MSHVIAIEAKHIQSLKAFRLENLDRPVTKILGENGEGKSTVIKLLHWLFYTKAHPEEILTHGESTGYIEGEFDIPNEELEIELEGSQRYIVKRIFNDKGQTLKVYPKDNKTKTISSPQEFVNRFFGTLGINPADFCEQDAEKQKGIILDLNPGLKESLQDVDKSYQLTYDKRRELNSELKQIQAYLEKLPKTQPTEKKTFTQLADQRVVWQAHNKESEDMRSEIAQKEREMNNSNLDAVRIKDGIKLIQEKRAELQRKLLEFDEEEAKLNKDIEGLRTDYTGMKARIAYLQRLLADRKDYDLSQLDEQIKEIEVNNAKALEWERRRDFEADEKAKRKLVEDANAELVRLKEEKEKLIKNAKYPIEGLEYTDKGLRYNGTLLESLCKTERILVGLNVQHALNPKFKFAVVDDAESYVGKSRQRIIDWAEETGIPVLMAIAAPSDTPEEGIVIEDGGIIRGYDA